MEPAIFSGVCPRPLKALVVLALAFFLVPGCGQDTNVPPPHTTPHGVEPWTGNPTTRTMYGAVLGFEDTADTFVWKAIPFAEPPVGPLRWKAPRDPAPWEETREATAFGNQCTQYSGIVDGLVVGNEDCLYLNIWRPKSQEKDLPVYFWIHGGGNSVGTASLSDYYGSNLASRSNVVVVTVNYRLGPLGWFTHPALRTGEPGNELDDSGNYGTLDLIKALAWVRDNIKAFGGDPGNVTITGESAGGWNVMSLLISPAAKGLFHRAIVQSGGALSSPVEEGELSARTAILKLLVSDGRAADQAEAETYLDSMTPAEVETYVRSKSAKDIIGCYEPTFAGMIDAPDIFQDGTVIHETGFATLDRGTYPNKVPIILGTNKEETKLFIFSDPYFEGKDELYQIVASYGSDQWKAGGVDEVARRLRSHADQPNVYAYQLLWGAWKDPGKSVIPDPWDFKLGSCHSLDIPFFFGNDIWNVVMHLLVFTKENRPGKEALSQAMMAYAAHFARTGDPNQPGSGLPEWSPWSNDAAGPKCILWDVDEDQALDIRMSTEELTVAGVKARMASEVPEPLYSEAVTYLGW